VCSSEERSFCKLISNLLSNYRLTPPLQPTSAGRITVDAREKEYRAQ
jgi:hypothetical protein